MTNATLEQLVDSGRYAEVSPQLYAKYAMLMALAVVTPEEVAEFKRAYERRQDTEKSVSSFKEKLRRVKPIGPMGW